MTLRFKRLRFSLFQFVAASMLWLGVALWGTALLLPAVRIGGVHRGIELLGMSAAVFVGPRRFDDLKWLSGLAFLLNILMVVAPLLWLFSRQQNDRRLMRRFVAVTLVFGFVFWTQVEQSHFDDIYVGYRVWIVSFLFSGLGLLLSSFRREKLVS